MVKYIDQNNNVKRIFFLSNKLQNLVYKFLYADSNILYAWA